MTPALADLVPLAEELDKDKVTPGVLGFVVFAVLGVAVWLLMKNMNKQFGKISFEEEATGRRTGKDTAKAAPESRDAGAGGAQDARPAPADAESATGAGPDATA